MGCKMVRTQIYLTEHQKQELAVIAKNTGKKQSEIIREAIDRLIEQEERSAQDIVLRETAGIWKERKDLPDFNSLRTEWDRP